METRFFDFKAVISINYKDFSNPKIIGQMNLLKQMKLLQFQILIFIDGYKFYPK